MLLMKAGEDGLRFGLHRWFLVRVRVLLGEEVLMHAGSSALTAGPRVCS